MQFHLFTMVYGAEHIDLFRNACFKSLMWAKNREAASGKVWTVYTKASHFAEMEAIFKDSPFTLNLMAIRETQMLPGVTQPVPTEICEAGVLLLNGLRQDMLHALQDNSKTLMAPPDTIFGNGTIANLLKLGRERYSVVTVAHPRVLPAILPEIEALSHDHGGISNRKLVELAMHHAHDSWKFAEVDHPENTSYTGGIAWQKLSDGMISVTHRLPTPYLIDYHPRDSNFWFSINSFGALDHTWPGDRLIRQQRMRFAGSSDMCFAVEITAADKNVPPKTPHKIDSNEFWGDSLHHETNRLFNITFRGERA